ncbi:MAG TPA: Fe-S-containing protein [Thermodesulfovibrionales bacterium]|nr:Fe-S-containing protein [Thermodesulfovibrionales bacterium]
MSKGIFALPSIKVLILSFILSFLPACSEQPSYPAPLQMGKDVVVDISRIPSEVPEFFTYHYHGKKINFFVVKANNAFLSFLDACVSCYAEKRGYRFDGGYVICRACNLKYPVSEIERGFGSCYPIRLQGHVQNGKYYISRSLLEGQVDKF